MLLHQIGNQKKCAKTPGFYWKVDGQIHWSTLKQEEERKPVSRDSMILLQGRLLWSAVVLLVVCVQWYSDSNVLFLVMDHLCLPDILNATLMPKLLQLLTHQLGWGKWILATFFNFNCLREKFWFFVFFLTERHYVTLCCQHMALAYLNAKGCY